MVIDWSLNGKVPALQVLDFCHRINSTQCVGGGLVSSPSYEITAVPEDDLVTDDYSIIIIVSSRLSGGGGGIVTLTKSEVCAMRDVRTLSVLAPSSPHEERKDKVDGE